MIVSECNVLSENRFKAPRFPSSEGMVKASSKGKYVKHQRRVIYIYIHIYIYYISMVSSKSHSDTEKDLLWIQLCRYYNRQLCYKLQVGEKRYNLVLSTLPTGQAILFQAEINQGFKFSQLRGDRTCSGEAIVCLRWLSPSIKF